LAAFTAMSCNAYWDGDYYGGPGIEVGVGGPVGFDDDGYGYGPVGFGINI